MPVSSRPRWWALVALMIAVAVVRPSAGRAVPGFNERLRAHGQLDSLAPATMFQTLDLELHLDLFIGGGEGSDGGSGTLRCMPSRPGGLPCPSATGQVQITEATGISVADETMARNFFRFMTQIDFGTGGTCQLDSFAPYRLSAPFDFVVRAPVVLFGNYVCARNGTEFDRGVFTVWQHGRARAVRSGH